MDIIEFFNDHKLAIIIFVILSSILVISYFMLKATKRIKNVSDLPKDIKNLKLKGYAIKVNDGDGLAFIHSPLLSSRKYKKDDEYIKIRLVGIDAPEVRKYTKPGQPFAEESKKYLQSLILNKKVTIKCLAKDKYDRVLATVFVDNMESKNVSIEMVRMGYACVYKGPNAMYDGYKDELMDEEKKAQKAKMNMWSQENYVSPLDYKKLKV